MKSQGRVSEPAQAKIGTRRLEEQTGRLQFLFPFPGVNVGSADGGSGVNIQPKASWGSAIAKHCGHHSSSYVWLAYNLRASQLKEKEQKRMPALVPLVQSQTKSKEDLKTLFPFPFFFLLLQLQCLSSLKVSQHGSQFPFIFLSLRLKVSSIGFKEGESHIRC